MKDRQLRLWIVVSIVAMLASAACGMPANIGDDVAPVSPQASVSQAAVPTQETEQTQEPEASDDVPQLPYVLEGREILFVTVGRKSLPVEYRLWKWHGGEPILVRSVVDEEERGGFLAAWNSQAIAYSTATEFGYENLWLTTLEDGHTRQVLSPEFLSDLPPGDLGPANLLQVAWLPDGSGVLFNTRQPTFGQGFSDDLHFVDRLSGEIKTVFPAGEGGRFEFSPDGRWLAVVSPTRIQLLSAATLKVINIFDHPPVATYTSARFYAPLLWLEDSSGVVATVPPPEGSIRRAGIEVESDGLTRLWQIPVDGTEPHVVAALADRGAVHSVSPNLRHVLYTEILEWREPQQMGEPNPTLVRLYHHSLETDTDTVLYEGIWPDIQGWLPDGESLLIRVPRPEGTRDPPWQRVDVKQNEWHPWPVDALAEQWLDDEHFLFRAGGGEELWLGNTGGEQWLLFRAEALIRNYQVVP